MKQTIKIILTLCFIFNVAAMPRAWAEEILPTQWEAPSNIVITDKSNTDMGYLYNFLLKVTFDKGKDLQSFLELSEDARVSKYGKKAKDIKAVVQIDWSIDNQEHWVYKEFSEEWDAMTSANSHVWDYSGSSEEVIPLTAEKTEERDILNLYANKKTEWLDTGLKDRVSPYVYTLEHIILGDVSIIDLELHTIYLKMRYAVKLGDGNEIIFSDWSDVVSIGMDAMEASGTVKPSESQPIDVTWSNASEWAANTVVEAAESGLYPAVLDKENLQKPATRRDFAGVAVSLLEKLGVSLALPESNPFVDTKDKNVLKLYQSNIMYGKSENEFYPMSVITREETAVILERIYTLAAKSGNIDVLPKEQYVYEDDDEISLWARNGVYAVSGMKLMEGVGGGRFAPKDFTTAEQALALSLRVYQLIN
ncbi:MAG: S-layer homology domain-containing protein [Clostridia bacterium]|nr:S-layer homology domain-containing protein [Clostridia bacterium]